MENQKRYVKLSVGHELLGVKYEYKHFLTSTCTESYSKYPCLSTDDAYVAYFTMEIFDTDRCSFKFYDGPYKDRWIHYDGGYLYVTRTYATGTVRSHFYSSYVLEGGGVLREHC
ncbi:hypothetical protein FD724_15980 [Nostoc sp. C057]|uniref:hypothetical protein n=1 Tax=Nostoc sp. C057 TaxID=2576903 RepID=UPI0015C2E476|nr:hypothetical protein [Nostoc sp. C057]QLE49447.1 hypothetical protein FD724_15980 [Nostoc sp. C057]